MAIEAAKKALDRLTSRLKKALKMGDSELIAVMDAVLTVYLDSRKRAESEETPLSSEEGGFVGSGFRLGGPYKRYLVLAGQPYEGLRLIKDTDRIDEAIIILQEETGHSNKQGILFDLQFKKVVKAES